MTKRERKYLRRRKFLKRIRRYAMGGFWDDYVSISWSYNSAILKSTKEKLNELIEKHSWGATLTPPIGSDYPKEG